jgi:hypothetical protein
MFLQIADTFLPVYSFRSQKTFITIIAVRNLKFHNIVSDNKAFQNFAFSSCVYISSHGDGSGGCDDDGAGMSMEAMKPTYQYISTCNMLYGCAK